MEKKRVIILISSFIGVNTGIGGNLRSALTMQKLLSDVYQTTIITYGDLAPPIYENLDEVDHVYCPENNWRQVEANVLPLLLNNGLRERILAIVFGGTSLYQIYMRVKNKNIAVAYCRAGGKPGKSERFYAGFPSIVFTGVDYERLKRHAPEAPIVTFRSRVIPPEYDLELTERFKNCVGWNQPTIADSVKVLIVCRFHSSKDSFIRPALDALGYLCKEKFSIVFVGIAQDKNYCRSIQSTYPNVNFVTEDRYTIMAVKLMIAADVIVAIGRTAQESISLSKPTFVPVYINAQADLVQIDENTVNIFAHHNFTQRAQDDLLAANVDLNLLTDKTSENDELELAKSRTILIQKEFFDLDKQKAELVDFCQRSLSLESIRIRHHILLRLLRLYRFLITPKIRLARVSGKLGSVGNPPKSQGAHK
jgi:hypothetical protein